MIINITAQIVCVDGETCYTLVTPRPNEVRNFLSDNDHEGSSITLTLVAYDEYVYRVLDAIMQEKQP